MKSAKHCDECRHFGGPVGPVCQLGHNPRFYIHGFPNDWGRKRRCDDFEPKGKAMHTGGQK